MKNTVEYIFTRIIRDGTENCKNITIQEIIELPVPQGEDWPELSRENAASLKRDTGYKLDKFYGEGGYKVPHSQSIHAKYRAKFTEERGNFLLTFPAYTPPREEPDLVPVFWSPHIPPECKTRTLYPLPFFLIDERQTYFRNSAMKTDPILSVLTYLSVPGLNAPGRPPTTGYSYVPFGIVEAMHVLGKALWSHQRQHPEPPEYEAVKPHIGIPPGDENIIVLATPTSTDIVGTIQSEHEMTVDIEGVHYGGKAPYDDNDRTHWGVLTRTIEKDRIITMLAAKHGRSVEQMMKFLTKHEQLALLAQRFQLVFPETFQVLFRMPVSQTPRDGPSVKAAVIEQTWAPELHKSESAI